MECIEERIDMRDTSQYDQEEGKRLAQLLFRLNHTMPMTDEYIALLHEFFGDRLGEESYVAAPFQGAAFNRITIGKNVYINANMLAMARGGITIEDGAQIAANVSLISNNHDPYDLKVLTCKPVLICRDAWSGANAVILPGVRVGVHAVVGAGSVVTKDVPDYAVVVGNPATVIKMLEPERFAGDEAE